MSSTQFVDGIRFIIFIYLTLMNIQNHCLSYYFHVVPKMKPHKPIFFPSSSHLAFRLFSLVIFLITTPTSASYGGNETDHLALLSFKSMITHDPHGALASWNTSFHYCDWNGVLCGKKHKRVTRVRLYSQGLAGYLSPHVGNLSFLRALVIFNNSFQGTIPQELGRLSRMSLLNFDRNKFEGVIPTNLSGCYNLDTLVISENRLGGSIPKEIGFLSKLVFIVIHRNNFTGGIPSFLGNLTFVESFSASRIPWGGNIPDTLGNWKRLKVLYLGVCNLNGTIPDSIYNLSLLTDLSLPDNQLTGSLPSTIGTTLPNIVNLQLSDNNLTGHLPLSISNCSKLELIEMSDNKFNGELAVDFAKLINLYQITLGGNFLGSGEADEMKFLDSLKNCSKLQILDIPYNNFRAVLPGSIGNLSYQLYYLSFGENQLYGNLPSSIGNLVGLTNLHLGGNRFTGKIPSAIGKLQNLGVVTMYGNQFEGLIPDAIGNLSSLNKLALNSNRLEGRIPLSLGNCQKLLGLFLSDNKLSDRIPKEILQLSSLSIILNLSHNNLLGSLPIEVGDLKMLTYLDLSHNNLSGNIPGSLGGCTSLLFLSLKRNSFQGIIPPSLSSMRGVARLDLSYNNLSGQIPRFLEHFSLEYLDLSFNDFEGEVPVAGVFSKTNAFSVSGNNRLCGGLVELGLPKCKVMKKHKKRFPLLIVLAVLIGFLLFSVLLFVYVWSKKRPKARQPQSSASEPLSNLTYSQLLEATNGFAEENLIGEGGFSSVYKGILHGGYVAVKVVHLQIRGADRSFLAECEVWRSIRHRNLLKIITSCSSIDFKGNDFKALVYEFMPNGNLHDWLHSSARKSRLDIIARIHILIDVACALDYLHNHCVTTIVHGDLKPSNILLDSDMVAHVGDFGLARFLGNHDSNKNNSLAIKGTIGYAAPEYGLGSGMTSSGDVYSFGILLLEVMTGKRPTYDIFNDGLNLHKFASMALQDDHVTDVIDGDLLNYHQDDESDCGVLNCDQKDEIAMNSKNPNTKNIEHCVTSLLKIGVLCSLDSPAQRMNIRNVVYELQSTLDTL
ncbi:receptor kinase-like protein Xa21 [Bidens hawaiensis]|uniref:receptor kinase-like protein Xa21 n=1 Tax=Bidens hawaiensis TaxID=980011 RepID=UPI004049BAA0